jgi:copper chaperone
VTEITLSVPDISCHHCKMAIEGAVGSLPGVTRAAVDVPARQVSLSFEAPATREQIVSTIEAQGYAVPNQG